MTVVFPAKDQLRPNWREANEAGCTTERRNSRGESGWIPMRNTHSRTKAGLHYSSLLEEEEGGGKTKHLVVFPTCCGHNRINVPGREKWEKGLEALSMKDGQKESVGRTVYRAEKSAGLCKAKCRTWKHFHIPAIQLYHSAGDFDVDPDIGLEKGRRRMAADKMRDEIELEHSTRT
ncbi:hypothetical protein B0H10DRAFT_1963664 [Mycena sp. CBHHK59/15]|nr:hypothetical protein B0H10DRAFT_1963664 [Mycena sp. CBHHK59/15]